MKTLALDLGNKLGWALGVSGLEQAGTARFKQPKGADRRVLDTRFAQLYVWLSAAIDLHKIERLVFEDVLFYRSRDQGQLWAGYRAVVMLVAAMRNMVIGSLNSSSLKKQATGWGNADKADMRRALIARGLDCAAFDDNAVDAISLLLLTFTASCITTSKSNE